MEEKVQFKNPDGESLAGTLHMPALPTKIGVVLGHCFTCSRHTGILRQIGNDLAESGIMSLRFDFSGNGQSEGEFAQSTFSKQISDMESACNFITRKGVLRMGLAGHSMGSTIALLSSEQIPGIKAVCGMAGRLSGTNAMRFLSQVQKKDLDQKGIVSFASRGRNLFITQNFFSDAGQFDLPELIRDLKRPVLIVHGDDDEIIPVDEAITAHALNPRFCELAIIKDANHMFSGQEHRKKVSALVVKWFEKQLEK